MFHRPVSPNSVDKNNQEDIQQLLANINQVEEIFDGKSTISKFELKELVDKNSLQIKLISTEEDDPENPIKILYENIINSDHHSVDAILTKSKLLDAVLEDWFTKQTFPLLIAGRLPEDGHNPIEDMFNFSQELAKELYIKGSKKISPDLPDLWNKFFLSKKPDLVIGAEACPLIKNENGFNFVSDKLIPYFIGRSMVAEFKDSNQNKV